MHPRWYYNNKDNNLSDKFFSTAKYEIGRNEHSSLIIDMLIHSSKAPVLKNEPQVVYIGAEEQLEELLSYLEKDYQIKMDTDNRFYRITKSRKSMLVSTERTKTEYFSWQEIIGLYNTSHAHFSYVVSNEYLRSKYNHLNELNKKYVYLNLKRIKGKGFEIESEKVVSIPK
jgi:hypothetical protein